VTLPPGRAKPATKPDPIGSPTWKNRIGIVDVAFFSAVVGGDPEPTSRSTLRCTSSAASAGDRLLPGRGTESRRPTQSTVWQPTGWLVVLNCSDKAAMSTCRI